MLPVDPLMQKLADRVAASITADHFSISETETDTFHSYDAATQVTTLRQDYATIEVTLTPVDSSRATRRFLVRIDGIADTAL